MAFVENLIAMVKQYPILYDLSHEDYKNVRKKDKVWKDVGVELKQSGEDLKKKWKNLRDTYMRYLKANKAKTGQAAKSGKKWQWAQQMEAFRPFLHFAETSSNVADISHTNIEQPADVEENDLRQSQSCDSDSNIEIPDGNDAESQSEDRNIRQSTCSQSSISSQQPNRKNTLSTLAAKRQKKNSTDENKGSSVESLINYFQNKTKPEMDATDLMFLSLAKTLKTFSKRRQALTKMKISQIISEAELQQIDEDSSTTPSPQAIVTSASASAVRNLYSRTPPSVDPTHAGDYYDETDTHGDSTQLTDLSYSSASTLTDYFVHYNNS